MPQSTQIVPHFMHPHIHTVVNDNTGFQDGVAGAPQGTRSIFVIRSPKGRDNEFLTMKGQDAFLKEYGIPVFKTHGQPAFNAYSFLGNTLVQAEIMRVTAENATYSNAVIVAKVKDNGDGTITVVISGETLLDLNSKEEFDARVQGLRNATPDEEGFVTFPLFGTIIAGKGTYGDSFRLRLVKDYAMDGDNAFTNYRFELNEFTTQLDNRNAWSGSLYEDAVHYKKSIFLSDLAIDDETRQCYISVPQDSLEAFYDFYINTVNPAEPVPFEEFDFIYGLQKNLDIGVAAKPIEGYILDSENEGYLALDSVEGVALTGGSDGDFGSTDEVVRETAAETVYGKAFRGEINKSILSKRRLTQDVFFDANYPDTVKKVIRAWLIGRDDAIGYLDAGKREDWDEIKFWAEDEYSVGHRSVSRNLHHHKIYCPFTSKRIEVTYTHFLAQELPMHWNTNGNQAAFVGDASQLYGHIRGSVKPVIDYDDNDIKEFLYLNRVNYMHAIKEEVFQRGTASTSLPGKPNGNRENKYWWSDLNEENYVHVMYEIKRELEEYIARKNYVFAEPEDRDRFTNEADLMMDKYRNVKVREVTVYFDMNEFEERRSILHCYVGIKFKSMAKRHILEIDINPRV